MYEVFVTKINRRTEKHRCETIEEVLKLFDEIDDNEISSVSIRRLGDTEEILEPINIGTTD